MNTLAESFNDMAAGRALKDRYHSVLQQVADVRSPRSSSRGA
jgi:hypothetical protein